MEEPIAQAVLFRLDTPALADALVGRAAADERSDQLADTLTEDQEQLAELTTLYPAKSITAREWMNARSPIQARIIKTEQAIARATRSDALAGLVGNGEQLRGSWASLNLNRQAAIVRAVLDHAVIGPGTPGAQALDPGRVQPVWRL